jgi:hypothetical protein
VAIPWTSIVTSSHFLDPRFPHDRGLSNRCVPGPGSPSDVVGGSSGTALTEQEFQCTWPTVCSRDGGRPWSPNQAHYYPLSAAVNGSSKAASLNKKTTEHGRGPPPLTTTFPGLQSRLPLRSAAVDGSSRTATTDRKDTHRDPVTSPTPARLTTGPSGRLPGREADSSALGC